MSMKRTMIWMFLVVCGQIVYGQDWLTKGKVALSSHDTTAAVQAFQASLKNNQKPAEANYYLGAIAYARHNWQEASTYLQASLKSNDENVDALNMLADVCAIQKNFPEALATYRRATKLAPKNAATATGYGMALLGVDSVDAAIIQLTRAKDLDGNSPAIYMALGDAYMRQGVPVLATGNYQKAIDLAPKNMEYRFKLAQTYEKNRQYTEAVSQYDSIATIDTTKVDALLEAGKILIRASGNQKKLAIKPLTKYVAKRPKSLEGATLLAKILFTVEDYPEAAKAARHALDIDSSSADLWRQYAYSLTEIKPPDYKTALYAFNKLQKMKQFKPEDMGKYGNVLVAAGQGKEAKSMFLQYIKLNTTKDTARTDSINCDVYFNMATLYMMPPDKNEKPDYDSAAYFFEKKIGCEPRSLSSYVNGAACYMQTKNFGRSRELLMKALELKPDFLQGRLWLARYYAAVDSLGEAITQYDLVLSDIGPDVNSHKREAAEAYQMKAALKFQTKQYSAVIEDLRKAQSLGLETTGLHLSWGQALLQLLDEKASADENRKKIDESITHFRKAVALDQNNAQAHLWLGQGLIMSRKEGDDETNRKLVEEACGEFRKVLKIDPKNQDAKKSMERVGCK
jgi:tetratricopeptide (TPR) repeat protein